MALKLRWLGVACFELVLLNSRTVVIDPYVDDSITAPITSDQFEGADFIFLTHGHFDHILDVGKLTKRFNSRIYCNATAAETLVKHQDISRDSITVVKTGDVVEQNGLRVETLKAIHGDFHSEYKRLTGNDLPDDVKAEGYIAEIRFLFLTLMGTDIRQDKRYENICKWLDMYPGGENLNFVFDPEGGKRIFMAATYPAPEFIEAAKRLRAEITLLQVQSGPKIRGLEKQTAELAIASDCKIVVPQHYDAIVEGASKTDLSGLKIELAKNSEIEFKEFIPGKWYLFD